MTAYRGRSEVIIDFEVDEHGRIYLRDFEFPDSNGVAYGVMLNQSSTREELKAAIESCAALKRFIACYEIVGSSLDIEPKPSDLPKEPFSEADPVSELAVALRWLAEEPDWEHSREFVVPYDGLGAAYEFFRDECTQLERLSIGVMLVPATVSREIDAHACLRTEVERANRLAIRKRLNCRFISRRF